MRISKTVLPYEVTVHPYTGNSAYGAVYGATFKTHARFEHKKSKTVDAQGSEIVANITAIFHYERAVNTNDKIEYKGKNYTVIECIPQTLGNGIIHHYEGVLR